MYVAKVVSCGSWYSVEVLKDGKHVEYLLDRSCRKAMWKTKSGAEKAAKREGYVIA